MAALFVSLQPLTFADRAEHPLIIPCELKTPVYAGWGEVQVWESNNCGGGTERVRGILRLAVIVSDKFY
jgi:hypothetical protein